MNRNTIIIIVVCLIVAGGGFWLWKKKKDKKAKDEGKTNGGNATTGSSTTTDSGESPALSDSNPNPSSGNDGQGNSTPDSSPAANTSNDEQGDSPPPSSSGGNIVAPGLEPEPAPVINAQGKYTVMDNGYVILGSLEKGIRVPPSLKQYIPQIPASAYDQHNLYYPVMQVPEEEQLYVRSNRHKQTGM